MRLVHITALTWLFSFGLVSSHSVNSQTNRNLTQGEEIKKNEVSEGNTHRIESFHERISRINQVSFLGQKFIDMSTDWIFGPSIPLADFQSIDQRKDIHSSTLYLYCTIKGKWNESVWAVDNVENKTFFKIKGYWIKDNSGKKHFGTFEDYQNIMEVCRQNLKVEKHVTNVGPEYPENVEPYVSTPYLYILYDILYFKR